MVILVSSFVLFYFSLSGLKQALDRDALIWLVVFICTTVITVILTGFFFFVGGGIRYTSDSRNWRLVVSRGWKFANKNHETLPEIEKLIEMVKHTKDPTELNKFMDNWKSPEDKKTELLRELDHKKQKLKETEDILSGKKAEQIKEEIEKLEEKIKKTQS